MSITSIFNVRVLPARSATAAGVGWYDAGISEGGEA